MKNLSFTILLLIAIAVINASNTCIAQANNLTWSKNFNESLEHAKREHKYVLVDVYTTWCGWCKKLDKDVFEDPNFVNYVKTKFICVKADAEDPTSGQELATKYGVSGFPTALVFNDKGNLVGTINGYNDTSKYIEKLGTFLKK